MAVTATTTWSATDKGADLGLSNGGLTASGTPSGADQLVRAVDAQASGKLYFEITNAGSGSGADTGFGVCNAAGTGPGVGNNGANGAVVFTVGGSTYVSGFKQGTIGPVASGATVGVALDAASQLIWFRGASGAWNSNAASANDPATGAGGWSLSGSAGPYFPMAVFSASVAGSFTANFGAAAFGRAAPAGFAALNTTTQLRLTQAGAETWSTATSAPLRVTQAGAEVWAGATSAPLRVTQAGAEAWASATAPPLRVTQAGAEVWLNLSQRLAAPASGFVLVMA